MQTQFLQKLSRRPMPRVLRNTAIETLCVAALVAGTLAVGVLTNLAVLASFRAARAAGWL